MSMKCLKIEEKKKDERAKEAKREKMKIAFGLNIKVNNCFYDIVQHTQHEQFD